MREIMETWVGRHVHLTQRVGGLFGVVRQQGKLVQVSEGGILLQLPYGQTFFPINGILHISLLDNK